MQHYHVDVIKTTREGKEHMKRIVVSANSEEEALDNAPRELFNPRGYVEIAVKITEEEWNAG
ncbi:MAG: hypothetical protein AAGB35_10090 [Pseudomonadota bacterium]